jgi:HD superfamily phosphohydrolase
MQEGVVIHDTVHGSIELDPGASALLGTPEVQRLAGIKQLGLACLVFPGANHTRLEHSIGTYHVASQVTKALGLDEEECRLVSYAALLHDLGHGPYSHTLERVLHEKEGIDHMRLTGDVITGARTTVTDEDWERFHFGRSVNEILTIEGIEPDTVASLVCGQSASGQNQDLFVHNGQGFFHGKAYLGHIIHGPVDCDQVDYLLRDSHYTGVAHGTIDLARLLQTLTIYNNDLVVEEKGVSAVEGMLVARSLMYSSVYFHKTVRIGELMLSKAVAMALEERDSADSVQAMDDAELMSWLHSLGGFQREIVNRLRYRVLYKSAFGKRISDLSDEDQKRLLELSSKNEWGSIERGICQRLGLGNGTVVIDIPEPDLLLSEPRISRTDIKVLSGDRLRSLSKYSPFSKAIQKKKVSRWAFLVACDSSHLADVSRAAKKLIFG